MAVPCNFICCVRQSEWKNHLLKMGVNRNFKNVIELRKKLKYYFKIISLIGVARNRKYLVLFLFQNFLPPLSFLSPWIVFFFLFSALFFVLPCLYPFLIRSVISFCCFLMRTFTVHCSVSSMVIALAILPTTHCPSHIALGA